MNEIKRGAFTCIPVGVKNTHVIVCIRVTPMLLCTAVQVSIKLVQHVSQSFYRFLMWMDQYCLKIYRQSIPRIEFRTNKLLITVD